MKQTVNKAAFTLMELLVTMSIIALLAAILLPTINHALQKGEIAKAQVEVNNIKSAWAAYYQTYGKWPKAVFSGSSTTVHDMDEQKVNILVGIDKTYNPLGKRFLELPAEAMADRRMADPWDGMYRFIVDAGYKDYITPPQHSDSRLPVKIGVWSEGPDGKPGRPSDKDKYDDVTSW